MSVDFCRQQAWDLLVELGVPGPPVDVEAVARQLGLTVKPVRRGGGFSAQLIREQLEIEVEQSHHPHRRRFSIGHEIGHFRLKHSPATCVFDDRSFGDPRRVNEHQANVFSSALLMPELWVRKHWTSGKQWRELVTVFGVSEQALWYKLDRDLNLFGLQS